MNGSVASHMSRRRTASRLTATITDTWTFKTLRSNPSTSAPAHLPYIFTSMAVMPLFSEHTIALRLVQMLSRAVLTGTRMQCSHAQGSPLLPLVTLYCCWAPILPTKIRGF